MTIDIEHHGELCIIRCKGRLTAGPDLEYVQSKMREIQKLNPGAVIADFSEVSAIGSMGITFIVGIYTSVRNHPQGRFMLAGAVPLVRQVLDLTKLSTVIPVAPDVKSAIGALCAEKPMALARVFQTQRIIM